jgi:hypothetical protein
MQAGLQEATLLIIVCQLRSHGFDGGATAALDVELDMPIMIGGVFFPQEHPTTWDIRQRRC